MFMASRTSEQPGTPAAAPETAEDAYQLTGVVEHIVFRNE